MIARFFFPAIVSILLVGVSLRIPPTHPLMIINWGMMVLVGSLSYIGKPSYFKTVFLLLFGGYFVLHNSFTAEENRVSVCWMRRMGLLRFSRAVVYVLQEVFGLEDEFCFVPPDEREGRFLLDEIMLAGNFGKYDWRYRCASGSEGMWSRFLRKSRRNFHLAVHYPGEVIWDVPFRVCHYLWRRMNGFI